MTTSEGSWELLSEKVHHLVEEVVRLRNDNRDLRSQKTAMLGEIYRLSVSLRGMHEQQRKARERVTELSERFDAYVGDTHNDPEGVS